MALCCTCRRCRGCIRRYRYRDGGGGGCYCFCFCWYYQKSKVILAFKLQAV